MMYALHLLSTDDRTRHLTDGGSPVTLVKPMLVEPRMLTKFVGADGLSRLLFPGDRMTYIEVVRPRGQFIIPDLIKGDSRVVMLVDEEGLMTRPYDDNILASVLYGGTIKGPAFIFLEDLVYTEDGPDHVLRSFTEEEINQLSQPDILGELQQRLQQESNL